MKRTTISLPDGLSLALERYREDQEAQVPVSTVVQAAIQEYLARRGYVVTPAKGTFHITPAAKGSGVHDVSIRHDGYFAEAVMRE